MTSFFQIPGGGASAPLAPSPAGAHAEKCCNVDRWGHIGGIGPLRNHNDRYPAVTKVTLRRMLLITDIWLGGG